jgi:hypothetical protein
VGTVAITKTTNNGTATCIDLLIFFFYILKSSLTPRPTSSRAKTLHINHSSYQTIALIGFIVYDNDGKEDPDADDLGHKQELPNDHHGFIFLVSPGQALLVQNDVHGLDV